MKKKILLIISMFLFMTNVKALTFNVNLTNIENEGNNGTIGSITNIDIPNKTLDTLFQNIGDEVNIGLTITNSGDRSGTLREIEITSQNDKIEYTTSLPEEGLAINGNDSHKIIVKAKVLEGATNGTSTSTITITYNYDEGTCPEGEILSEDESMCLCPEGKERNEKGLCVKPETKVECEDDEIYNETKKICEKKEPPITPNEDPKDPPKEQKKITPSNPKTLDNIILITLLFVVSGLGIYAVMFKKLNTNKKKVTVGVITGVITLGASFTVLVSVFGLDNLLSAIVNPITKSKTVVVTVNEEIDFLETWNGTDCSVTLSPEYIFDGGSGTEEDPYQIKTADQLVCFAKSVNNGTTYEGQFIKQTKDIKLNNNLIATAKSETTTGLYVWTPIGDSYQGNPFAGTYDGDNHFISGTYLTDEKLNKQASKGLFGYTRNAIIKNLSLSDTYIKIESSWPEASGTLIGMADNSLTVKDVTTSGEVGVESYGDIDMPNYSGGIVGKYNVYNVEDTKLLLEDITNNIGPVYYGIVGNNFNVPLENEEPNVTIKNVTNNASFACAGILAGGSSGSTYHGYFLFDNVVNKGNTYANYSCRNGATGIGISLTAQKIEIKNSHNEGNITRTSNSNCLAGLFCGLSATDSIVVDNSYNSGIITGKYEESYSNGLTQSEVTQIQNSNPVTKIAGLIGTISIDSSENKATIKNSYNSGKLSGLSNIGGLVTETHNGDASISNKLIIDNSYNIGAINVADGHAGGLVALTKGTIKNSYNSGEITVFGNKDTYSMIGNNHFVGTSIGGLVGNCEDGNAGATITGATIIDSYNEGDIIVTAKTDEVDVGGICGICGDITNSTNSGNITSKYAATAFEGLGFITGTITSSSSTGIITTENLTY